MKPQVEKKTNDKPRTSVVIVPSAHLGGNVNEGDTTEITAQISIPQEGGWGWVVMITSFANIFIIDGVVFSFGSIYTNIRDDLQVAEYLVTLINSITYALYYLASPIGSAIINRYGFRECTMIGSVVICIALLCTYFSPNYGLVLFFYGFLCGFGACLINMPSNLVVGFYFEKIRALVMSISASGSSLGIMVLFPLNDHFAKIAGWRSIILFQSGLCGLCYFLGMTYKPLMSLFITKTTDEDIRTVTYLPKTDEAGKKEELTTATERVFNTVSSNRFPTAAAVVAEGVVTPLPEAQAGTSAVSATKLTVTAHAPSGISQKQLKSLHSMLSGAQLPDKANKNLPMSISVEIKPPKKIPWWKRCCHWEKNVPGARPMYRDDAFYGGKVENLKVYRKSVADIPPESRTGLEYQMAVTRAATAADIKEKRGVFTTAFKRIFVSMVDFRLLKRFSFTLCCISGFGSGIGLLIPYVFLAERNRLQGMDPQHCNYLISVIAFTNLVGRIILGVIACKVTPVKVYLTACLMSGLASIASTFTYNLYFQYLTASVFGFFIGSLVSLRSLVLVNLYGLEMLTNATGLMVMFQGVGGLLSTPGASVIKDFVGFNASFIFGGTFLCVSGLVLLPVKLLANREDKAAKISAMAQANAKTNQNVSYPPLEPHLPPLSENPSSSLPSRASNITKLQSNISRTPPQ